MQPFSAMFTHDASPFDNDFKFEDPQGKINQLVSYWKDAWDRFTTLHFLRNLQMGSVNWSVCHWQAFSTL